MRITFCGHGTITYTDETRKLLRDTIEKLISEGAEEFLLGGYGAFDVMAANAVKSAMAANAVMTAKTIGAGNSVTGKSITSPVSTQNGQKATISGLHASLYYC